LLLCPFSAPLRLCASIFLLAVTITSARAADRPNILWISCEDISSHLHCYGYEHAITPTLDKLAERGTRYTHAFTTCPVCATNRSSIITGMYPTSIGTHYMRCGARLPEHIRCFTEYLREAGYYCTNNSKTDYNFGASRSAWDESSGRAHWGKRKPGQPFFHVRNFTNTHESRNWPRGQGHLNQTKSLKPNERQDPAKLPLPPYYVDTPETRRDWANYYENITQLDYHVAALLKQLEDDGLADDTIVIYWSDHGVGLPRGKRWPYDSGTRVPMISYIPEKWRVGDQGKPGTVTDELVSFIDLAPTVLNLAGVKIPKHMQGRAFMGKGLTPPRDYAFSVRDRMDERYDMIRSIRNKRYRYTVNFMSWKPYVQWLNYAERNQTMKALRQAAADGKLPKGAKRFMGSSKPFEELYDLEKDPYEMNNLAANPSVEHQELLDEFRKAQLEWALETRDLGLVPEPIVMEGERVHGNRFEILRQPGSKDRIMHLHGIANRVSAGDVSIDELNKIATGEDPVARYWAALGLTNVVKYPLPTLEVHSTTRVAAGLAKLVKDKSPVVRAAAADGLCYAGKLDEGLAILIKELAGPAPWVQLYAAIALDELDAKAKPATEALKTALKKSPNNYVRRVAERALQVL
jgi:uncharacterized sulfatase